MVKHKNRTTNPDHLEHYEVMIERLEREDIPEEHREKIIEFVNHLEREGIAMSLFSAILRHLNGSRSF